MARRHYLLFISFISVTGLAILLLFSDPFTSHPRPKEWSDRRLRSGGLRTPVNGSRIRLVEANNGEQEHSLKTINEGSERSEGCLHLAFLFVAREEKEKQASDKLDHKLKAALKSVMERMEAENEGKEEKLLICLCIHLITNQLARKEAQTIVAQVLSERKSTGDGIHGVKPVERPNENAIKFRYHAIDAVTTHLKGLLPELRRRFGPKRHALYFASLVFHRYFSRLDRIILMDVDMKVIGSLRELHNHFQNFDRRNIIGLVYDQQPVYGHLLAGYRKIFNESQFGLPADPGFNSGLLLLDLERMRASETFNSFLAASAIRELSLKYHFRGDLGDQDLYTLMSFEDKDLFYVLGCEWNRQLCRWWQYHVRGRDALPFDKYYDCRAKKVQIYHGNCNSIIPSNV